ncbi:MAG: hypothetical protein QG671_1996, partial [Actinomycetota bacterium]|nr:hypothetical protein [Actinomycetota bacterium]
VVAAINGAEVEMKNTAIASSPSCGPVRATRVATGAR